MRRFSPDSWRKPGARACCSLASISSVVRMLAMGALTWVAEWYDPEGPMTPDDIADELMRVLTKGIAKL